MILLFASCTPLLSAAVFLQSFHNRSVNCTACAFWQCLHCLYAQQQLLFAHPGHTHCLLPLTIGARSYILRPSVFQPRLLPERLLQEIGLSRPFEALSILTTLLPKKDSTNKETHDNRRNRGGDTSHRKVTHKNLQTKTQNSRHADQLPHCHIRTEMAGEHPLLTGFAPLFEDSTSD